MPWRHTFANGPFGDGFVRITATPVVNYAQYDQPGIMARAVNPGGRRRIRREDQHHDRKHAHDHPDPTAEQQLWQGGQGA